MSESTALATIRLSVVGDAGRVDLAVPRWADVGAVAAGFRDQTGSGPVLLSTATGRALDPTTSVHAARLEHGDLLVAVDADAAPVSTAPTGRGSRGRRAQPAPSTPAPPVVTPPTDRAARSMTGSVVARLAPAAVAVSQAGLILFVALVAPHLVRHLAPSGHRFLLPASAGMGAATLLAADIGARWVLAPQELPVGVVTGVGGGLYLLALLHRRSIHHAP